MTTAITIIGALSLTFAILCATADWAIQRLITMRRRRRIIAAREARAVATPLARWMREEWQ